MEENKELTEEEKRSLIAKLLECYDLEQEKNLQKNDKSTFFEILNRTYDEDLISRMLAYILKNDKYLVWKLLEFYGIVAGDCPSDFEIELVKCEQLMRNGRADIFVKAKIEKQIYTLTIENKIWSEEHGDQTQIYYNYVNDCYKNSKNTFLFLKPNFNHSSMSCEKFKAINYDEFAKMISDNGDYKVIDIKKHIKEFLTMEQVKFTDVDIKVLENVNGLRKILNEADDKLSLFKKEVFSQLCNGRIYGLKYNPYDYRSKKGKEEKDAYWHKYADNNDLVVDLVNDDTIFLIYKAQEWKQYNEERKDGYHFYVEIKFDNNDPKDILVQELVKRECPKAKKGIIEKFLESVSLNGEWDYGRWYVMKKERFPGEKDFLSIEWKNELLDFASGRLNNYIKEMDQIFEKFKEWRKTNE